MNKFLNICFLVGFFVVLFGGGNPCCGHVLRQDNPWMVMVGGFTPVQPATERIRQISHSIQSQIISKISSASNSFVSRMVFEPISYRSQVVNGTIYIIKIGVRVNGQDVFYHVRVYQSLRGDRVELNGVAGPFNEDADIRSEDKYQ